MSIDVKYDTTPCDGTPGQPWEDFKRRLRNVATRSDERGYSLADHFDDLDEGGGAVGAPAMPAAPAELRKALAARRRRQKDAYALLTKHLLHKEHLQHITQNFFQNGRAAYNYLDTALSQVIDQIRPQARLVDGRRDLTAGGGGISSIGCRQRFDGR